MNKKNESNTNNETTKKAAKQVDVFAYMKAISHNMKLIKRLYAKIDELQKANVKMRDEVVEHLNNGGEL